MNRIAAAQLLGALSAIGVGAGWIAWRALRPPACPGGIFIELHPPLAEPGPYLFRLDLDGEKTCEFSASPARAQGMKKTSCGLPLELRTQINGTEATISAITVGASPSRLRFQVRRAAETIYDTVVEPKYAPYPIRREDDKRFCGDRALVAPACIRGSSGCTPFASICDGPEDCPAGKACCVSAEWGKSYGVRSASECDEPESCLDRFGIIACHTHADCSAATGTGTATAMTCRDALNNDFKGPLLGCAR